MYKSNLTKGRIAATARRGPPMQLDFESYDTRDKTTSKASPNGEEFTDHTTEMSAQPRPTFQKGRQMSSRKSSQSSPDVHYNDNHLEVAALLSRQWKKVEDGRNPNKDGESLYELYKEKDFKSLGSF